MRTASHVQRLTGLRPFNKVLRNVAEPRLVGGRLASPQQCHLEEAVRSVESGEWICLHHAASTPVDLLNALAQHAKAKGLKDVRPASAMLMGDTPFDRDPGLYEHVRPVVWFVSSPVREAVDKGKADYVPIFLNDACQLFDNHRVPCGTAFLNLSPPDENGFCSLGVSCDFSTAAARNAKTIVATINESQPRTFGDVKLHISHVDYLVPHTPTPIATVPPAKITKEEAAIGKFISENLVEDEATLQLGIGSIPDAVLSQLGNHKNLGVHTEMISDGIIPLIKSGVVNNSKKSVDAGKCVLTFAVGSKQLYEFINNNDFFEFGSAGYTNDVHTIACNHRMTAINSAIEVDLTGQVVSGSIGPKIFSGFGGQVDFVYGSGIAFDGRGKSIIAITSRTNKGVSKIVPWLKEGAGVVTTRAHVHHLVTEYGIADLWGRSLAHRAHELIRIAHPDDRAGLERAAFDRLGVMPRTD